MKKIITVQLIKKELKTLGELTNKWKANARVYKRAQCLLLSHKYPDETEENIADKVGTSPQTLWRTKVKYNEWWLDNALYDKPRSGQPPKCNDNDKIRLTAIACSKPPKWRDRMTLELAQEIFNKWRTGDKKVSREFVRLFFKKANLNLGR